MQEEIDASKIEKIGIQFSKLYLILLFGGIPAAMVLGVIVPSKLSLNELGDFLAGAFGPLAIFWLVLSFFQQKRELQNSSRALILQADELKESTRLQAELISIESERMSKAESDRKGKFVVEHNSTWHNGEFVEYYIDVTNLGHAVASFAFLFGHGLQETDSRDGQASAEMEYPVWESMTGRRYIYRYSEPYDHDGSEIYADIDLYYTDANGERLSRRFRFGPLSEDAFSLTLEEIPAQKKKAE